MMPASDAPYCDPWQSPGSCGILSADLTELDLGATRNVRTDSLIRWGATVVAAASAIAVAVLIGTGLRSPQDDGRAACAGQLARLGRALRLYADDHDGRFPVAKNPGNADRDLLPLLGDWGIAHQDLYCPALPMADAQPYAYHCYGSRGPGDWPKWMPEEHIVTTDSPPDAWLMADHLARDTNGPHSPTEKAFNYLCVDGHVRFKIGRPRDVYK